MFIGAVIAVCGFPRTITYHILCWFIDHRLNLRTVTKIAAIPSRKRSDPPVCQPWAAAPQGVPAFIAFNSPCTRFDGVGSGHFIKLVSTHCIIASPFLRLGFVYSSGMCAPPRGKKGYPAPPRENWHNLRVLTTTWEASFCFTSLTVTL